MSKNMVCGQCGERFHWCPTCDTVDDDDHARDCGFCTAACARKHWPTWKPWDDGDDLVGFHDLSDLLNGGLP